MKNLKLAARTSIIVVIILTIGLFGLWFVVNSSTSNLMKASKLDDMGMLLNARKEIVNQYVNSAEEYLAGFGQGTAMKDTLLNPGNAAGVTAAQAYTEAYASVNPQLENIYLANYDTTVITSYVTGAIGMTLREGESREQLHKAIYASKNVYNTGILASKSTGQQVISMYCPIYDGDTPIGFVGGAILAEGLRNTLNELDAANGGSNEYMLLDAAQGTYIFCADDAKIGQPVEDVNIQNIITKAMSGDGSCEYKEAGTDMLAVYTYMADRGWVLVTAVDCGVAFKDIIRMSVSLAILCLVIDILLAISIWFAMRLIAKDISNIADVIAEFGTLDLTLKQKLEKYSNRKDEVGAIAVATMVLTDAVSDTVRIVQGESKQLATASVKLVENVNSSAESINNMECAIQEIAGSATQQAMDTQTAASNVVQIGAKIEATMKETDRLSEYADNIQTTGQELLGTVKALSQANESTKKAIEDIGVQTISTNESAIKIKDAAQLITSIAEETNLLSLNASIEAARAGEQGRGFAVVASQIQKLAEQSNESARFIDNIINTLLTDSEKAVESMNEMRSVMMEQMKQLEHIEVQFEQMYQNIGITKQGVATIHQTIQDMDKDRTNVVNVVENLSDIAEGNAASTEETLASTELVGGMMKNITEVSQQLAAIIATIDEKIANFTV